MLNATVQNIKIKIDVDEVDTVVKVVKEANALQKTDVRKEFESRRRGTFRTALIILIKALETGVGRSENCEILKILNFLCFLSIKLR